MQAPAPLLQRLQATAGLQGGRRLVLLLTQLGDFDSMEYAQALAPELPKLEAAGIHTLAIAIGNNAGAAAATYGCGTSPSCSRWMAFNDTVEPTAQVNATAHPRAPWSCALFHIAPWTVKAMSKAKA